MFGLCLKAQTCWILDSKLLYWDSKYFIYTFCIAAPAGWLAGLYDLHLICFNKGWDGGAAVQTESSVNIFFFEKKKKKKN